MVENSNSFNFMISHCLKSLLLAELTILLVFLNTLS